MNKREIANKISERTGVNIDDCSKVINAFEDVLSEELNNSKEIGVAFDKLYKMLSFFKNKR